jgi:acetyl esterase/lipase
MADLASPSKHVTPDAPPALLFHGEYDAAAPPVASRRLYQQLVDAGVPAVYKEVARNEHAYDLILAQIAPAARATHDDLEGFLALMASD